MRRFHRKEKKVVGIAWYRPEQWERLREVSADVDILEETHAEWVVFAAKQFDELNRRGISVIKVDVDVEELLQWCGQKGVAVDANARAGFVLRKVQDITEKKV